MSSTTRLPRRFVKSPLYCVLIRGGRALQHGLYKTKFDAAVRLSQLLAQKIATEDELDLGLVWVDKRD